MEERCVPAETLALIDKLGEVSERHQLALGGGTACALRLGHRVSRDLDLFGLNALDPPALLADLEGLLEQRLRGISASELAVVAEGIDFFATSLGRKPLEPPEHWRGIAVLSELDLAELKVQAAVRRGMVRDLCDLHLLCKRGVDLERAVRASGIDLVTALKAVADPARFRDQPAPELRVRWSIEEASDYFTEQARRLLA
jgi:hypothetical protein